MIQPRRLILFSALIVTVLLVAWIDDEDELEMVAKDRRSSSSAVSGTDQRVPASGRVGGQSAMTANTRAAYGNSGANLFASRDWSVLEVQEDMPALPPEPPPLPFSYVGSKLESDGTVLFLLYQDRTLAVRSGDVIDGIYKLEKVTAESAVLVYLPLKQQQSLDFGSAN